jgi:hypothetical protein
MGPSMDYELERKVLFNSEPEHKLLYGWCLNEIDENGNKIEPDLIPWSSSLYFTASSLRVVRNTSIQIKSEDNSTFVSESSQRTEIRGIFQSGYQTERNKIQDNVRFSFMGTEREIQDFSLSIWASKEAHQDSCSVVAIPSYESEIGFRKRTEKDYLGFEISLNKKYFEELVCAIEAGSADNATMRVKFVQGFYSEWSPSIYTNFIKVLPPEVTVDGLDAGKFTPPTTNIARDFDLTITRVRQSGPQTSPRLTQPASDFLDRNPDSSQEDKTDVIDSEDSKTGEYFRNSFDLAFKATSGLKFPLWAIFLALVFLLLK